MNLPDSPPPDLRGPDLQGPARPETVLILAPFGRDAVLVDQLLAAAGMVARTCQHIADLVTNLREGAGAALITEEAIFDANLRELAVWIAEQPKWSDFPIVLLIRRGGGAERNPAAMRWMDLLRNVALVERPFHPVTLVSVVRTAIGSRMRQYEARALIEAHRSAAEALGENEEHLRFALAAAQLGAWSLDLETWTLEASDQYRANFGRPAGSPLTYDEMQGSVPQAEQARMRDAVSKTLQSGEPYDIEYQVTWPDGSEHVLASRARLMESGGRGPRLVGVSSDVTMRRRRDDELARYRERLEELVADRTRELQAANRQLKAHAEEREAAEARLRQAQKMEAVGQLTGGIAHDFNNLLSAIMGSLELIGNRTQDERIQRLATNALTAVNRGARLTKQLLAFSRTQRLDLVPVALNALVSGMHELLASSLGPAVVVRFALDPEIGPCLADANQLELAVLNLAINSRDAMPAGGTVTISTGTISTGTINTGTISTGTISTETMGTGRIASQTAAVRAGMVFVAVSDTGEGMKPDVQERAFEPFFTTKPLGRGTGLGLSQVYGIARQSGGTATIESEAGTGTKVTIILPQAGAMPAAEAAADRVPLQDPATMPAIADTILVIDDDAEVRQFLVESLRTLGYRVAEASGGQAGLDRLAADPTPDLMIVDFAMPGMTGAEVATEALRARPGLPIVLATGYAETAALAGELSQLPVLRKPFHLAELATAVHGALRKS